MLLSDVDVVTVQDPFKHLYRDSDVEGMSDGFDDNSAYGEIYGVDDPSMGWSRYAQVSVHFVQAAAGAGWASVCGAASARGASWPGGGREREAGWPSAGAGGLLASQVLGRKRCAARRPRPAPGRCVYSLVFG